MRLNTVQPRTTMCPQHLCLSELFNTSVDVAEWLRMVKKDWAWVFPWAVNSFCRED